MKRIIILLLIFPLFLPTIYSQTVYAVQDGDWHNPNTWNIGNGEIPDSLDIVTIKGHNITITDDQKIIKVKDLVLENKFGAISTSLTMLNNVILNVSGNMRASANNFNNDIDLVLRENANLYVTGEVEFIRSFDNFSDNGLQIEMSNESKFGVSGNFVFDYKSAGSGEAEKEVVLQNKAELKIDGDATFNCAGGAEFNLLTSDTASIIVGQLLSIDKTGGELMNFEIGYLLDITGNLAINNTNGANELLLTVNKPGALVRTQGIVTLTSTPTNHIKLVAEAPGAAFDFRSSLNFTASADDHILIDLKNGSQFFIGGNVSRLNNFGNLFMEEGSQFTFDGATPQTLPPPTEMGIGNDIFAIKSVKLDNPAGFILLDTLFITEDLELSEGILISESYKPIVLADSVEITGGSETGYIDGPIIKKGRSTDEFVFPIGDEKRYAPITVGKIRDESSVMIAEFRGDPPPFGVFEGRVSENEHWILTQEGATVNLPITLDWRDAEASGITNLDSLIVVGLNADGEWESFGQGAITGGLGSGVSGSIQSLEGDPPPFGVFEFAFGSTDLSNPLPVELARFNAIKQGTEVQLLWETATETNTSHFTIERSFDGVSYENIGREKAEGESVSIQRYDFKDIAPVYGDNYYRLKIEDKDGSIEYSPVEIITFELIPLLSIVPNPVKNELRIEGPGLDQDAGTMEIFDQSGRLIYSGVFNIENGQFLINTSLLNINNVGTYFLKISGSKEFKVFKFMKIE